MKKFILIAALALTITACGTEGTTTVRSDAAGPSSSADANEQWFDDNGWAIEPISDDLDAIQAAAENSDYYGMESACADLKRHVEAAKDIDPVPDPDVDYHLQAALDDYRSAAAYCLSAIGAVSVDDMRRSADFIRSGSDHIQRAIDALDG